jgi:predicted Zn-dependent protease
MMGVKRGVPLSMLLCLLLVGFVSGPLTGCALNPATGEQQLILISEQDEARMGRSTDRSVSRVYGLYDDQALQNYVAGIGAALARNSHRPDLSWRFRVIDSPVINAFAAPGGYVYVTRGLLAAVNSEAELAGVLGHEIGHVTARHSAQQYSEKMLAGIGLGLGESLLGSYGDLLTPVLETGAGLLFLNFSREDERQADALGVDYTTRTGYDAARSADLFVTLASQPGRAAGSARLPEFLSTHPSPADREATVRGLAARTLAQRPAARPTVNREALLQMIDGLVYGEDPRQGFFEEGWFYLPEAGVKWPVPQGWSDQRQGNDLQLRQPDGKAFVLVALRPDSTIEQAVEEFLRASKARVQSDTTTSVNGMTLRQLVSLVASARGRTVVLSSIYRRGRQVFAFHAVTGEQDYAELYTVMRRPAAGFARMTDRARLERQPLRVHVERAGRSAPLERLLAAAQVDRERRAEIAWLNAMALSDTVPAGEAYKLLR